MCQLDAFIRAQPLIGLKIDKLADARRIQ